MELERIFIYRITHIQNIPHIIKNGITHRNSPSANPDFMSIGDVSLIDNRSNRQVQVVTNQEQDISISITLGRFIPFYFGVRMPMLYVIQNGGNFVERPIPPSEIIYLACPITEIRDLTNNYFFSDGHATDNFTTFFNHELIESLPNQINWNAVQTKYWAGHENLDLKRQKQAEFLIGQDIPFRCIKGFGCYNEQAKTTLIELGIEEGQIKIIPNAYY